MAERQNGKDGTPAWCYDEDGYCIRCGYGRWRFHGAECELRDLLSEVAQLQEDADDWQDVAEATQKRYERLEEDMDSLEREVRKLERELEAADST